MVKIYTIRDFLLYFIKNEYIERANIIANTVPHIESLHTDFILSIVERNKYIKAMNDAMKNLNTIFDNRMKLLDKNYVGIQSNNNENYKNIKLQKITNMDIELSKCFKFELKAMKIDVIYKMSKTLYVDDFNKICPNDFKLFDYDMKKILMQIGTKSISSIVNYYYNNVIQIDNNTNMIVGLLDNLFVPVCMEYKNELSMENKCKLTQCKKYIEKYEMLLDNYYKFELNCGFKMTIYGYIKTDCINSIVNMSFCYANSYNEYVNSHFYTIQSYNNSKSLNDIPDSFKNEYIANMNIGEIIAHTEQTYIDAIMHDYKLFKKYTSTTNFKLLFEEFMRVNVLTKYKIIKYLLIGQNAENAGLLFGLVKESKTGSFVIADIIYKHLNHTLQLKLFKTNTTLKEEIEKIDNLNIDDVDMKKQICANCNMPNYVKKYTYDKIAEMKAGNSEYHKQLLYVKTLMDYPWTNQKESNDQSDIFYGHTNNIKKCKEIMETTYKTLCDNVYGHNNCKDALVEMLGKWLTNPHSSGKAIGLIGPPGVGKTLIAKELGNALNMPCVKINLGGMSDGAILSGHSITYSGAVPGLIVKKMIEAGKSRCIIVFDELDKTSFHHGRNEIFDILIHLIDSTTKEFYDNFFQDIAFTKEKVIFFFLFNDKSKIDPILLDRMETIEVGAYSTEDKINIVNDHLINKIKNDIGLTNMNIAINDEDIIYLIENFTYEAGVRDIERKIDKLLLKLNKDRIFETGPFCPTLQNKIKNKKNTNIANITNITNIVISKDLIDKYLEKPNILIKQIGIISEVGVINGLYATSVNGGILQILMYKRFAGNNDKFLLKLTGQQGNVMKESVEFAFTIALNMLNNDIVTDFFDKYRYGLHIHLADACKKDGPSAGGAFTICFLSIILNKRIKNTIGLTGEIDKNGDLSAIGGLNYKLPGAKKAGVKLVFVPMENEKDIEKIMKTQKTLFDDNFKYMLVSNIKQVMDMALIDHDDQITDNCTYEQLFNYENYCNNNANIKIKTLSKINVISSSESIDKLSQSVDECTNMESSISSYSLE